MADTAMKQEDEQYDVQDPDAGGNDEVRCSTRFMQIAFFSKARLVLLSDPALPITSVGFCV